jgi:hypothetical protein
MGFFMGNSGTEERRIDSKIVGQEAEDKFKRACACNNIHVTPATKDEDKKEHIDFWVKWDDGKLKPVDVKAVKKLDSKSYILEYFFFTIEWQNVLGKAGWVLGKSKYIVFETAKNFLFIPRVKLVEWWENNVDMNTVVDENHKAMGCVFYRRGNGDQDIISIISIEELMLMAVKIIIKELNDQDYFIKGESVYRKNMEKLEKNRLDKLREDFEKNLNNLLPKKS